MERERKRSQAEAAGGQLQPLLPLFKPWRWAISVTRNRVSQRAGCDSLSKYGAGEVEQNCRNTRGPGSSTRPSLTGRFPLAVMSQGWGRGGRRWYRKPSIHHVLLLKIIILECRLFPVFKAYYLVPVQVEPELPANLIPWVSPLPSRSRDIQAS